MTNVQDPNQYNKIGAEEEVAPTVARFCRDMVIRMQMDLSAQAAEVDRTVTVNLSGSDRPLLLSNTAALLNSINVRAIRVINDENGSYVDQSGNVVPSSRLGWDLPWIRQYGYTPHVVVGQRCPSNFPCPAANWDAATWSRYADYAYKFVRWVATQFDGAGFAEAMFEVGNRIALARDEGAFHQLQCLLQRGAKAKSASEGEQRLPGSGDGLPDDRVPRGAFGRARCQAGQPARVGCAGFTRQIQPCRS